MKTIIYVDGYNLYYGCLKHTRDKWLDLIKLFDGVLKQQDSASTLLKIKFFTADIKAKVATRGQNAMVAQQDYHRALLALYPDSVEIIKGFYSLEKANLLTYQQPPDKTCRVDVWRLEEKQTDVSMALHCYRDVAQNHCEQIVIVSNDSDLEPVLQVIHEDFGGRVKLGLVIPARKAIAGAKQHRPGNKRLSEKAHWTRRYLLSDELAAAQLPEMIPTKKKPIKKPVYW